MSVKVRKPKTPQQPAIRKPARRKSRWETPKMQDVSDEVMAQPYIRFT
jgi:hypothetical protein